jgi:hypothetical protein
VLDYSGDREVVNQMSRAWVSAEEFERTPHGPGTEVVLTVGQEGDAPVPLVFPDMAGEEFAGFFAKRRWPRRFDALVRACGGVLLFVHPAYLRQPTTLAEVEDLTAAAGGGAPVAEDSSTTGGELHPHGRPITTGEPASEPTPNAWDATKTPDAVVLVDLLQAIAERRRGGAPVPIALVVSAWDLVAEDGLEPDAWVAEHLALLAQYLTTNPVAFRARVFGVSANGGDVTDPASRERLTGYVDPAHRVRVVGDAVPVAEHHDISVPVRWLLGQAAL